MILSIVVLYMAITCQFPSWCVGLIGLDLILRVLNFGMKVGQSSEKDK